MKNLSLPVMLALVVSLASHSLAEEQPESAAVPIPGVLRFDMTSAQGRTYRIFVRAPSGAIPEAGSPVIYLTDGNQGILTMVAAAARQRTSPSTVIVGIGYPDLERQEFYQQRSKDLLFQVDPAWWSSIPPEHRSYLGSEAGGANDFLDFILQKVKPEIERRYTIDPQRQMLFGHSLGGLFVLHTLFQRPESFNLYCAASPSIWVNERSILKEVPHFLKKLETMSRPVSLVLNVGEEEAPGFGGPPDREEMLRVRRQVENARELFETLSGKSPLLKVSFEVFANEDHGTSLLTACTRAMKALAQSGLKNGPAAGIRPARKDD